MKKLSFLCLLLFPCILKAQPKDILSDAMEGKVYPTITDKQVDRWNTPFMGNGLSAKNVMDDPFTVINSGLPGVDGPITKWGDYDKDGDMDLYLCGFYSGGISDIFRNNGNGTFTALGLAFEIVSGSADWGDFDCDGDLDLLISGNCTSAGSHITRLYRNDGAGVFTNYAMDVPGGSLAKWGDYDSDGDPDILINEADENGNNVEIYENKGTGTYRRTDIYFQKAETEFISISSASFDWGDYNDDGFPDLVISGTDDIDNEYCKIYRNNGDKTFTDLDLILRGVSTGRVNWGDFDNDSDLDILLSGYKDVLLYINEGNDGFSFSQANLAQNQEISTWIDVNNDGNLDMILSGLSNSGIYTGDGKGSFEYLPCPLANVQHADIDIADYDNDNDLDFVYAGYSSGLYTQIYKNNTTVVNHTPSIPTGLTARQNGADVVFSWNPANDYENGENLSYNITAGTSSGDCIIVTPLSNLTNGKRLKLNRGNAGNDTTWVLKNAPLGVLHWSVQSIDRTLKGSAFAAFRTFEVKTPFTDRYVPDPSYNVTNTGSSFIDMNNDGLLDILVSGSHPLNPTKEVDCFINQGSNAFTRGTITGSKLVGGFIPCNLNGDTYMDALLYGSEVMYSGPKKVYGLINNKSGGFTISTVDFANITDPAIANGDFDNDGDEDILFIGYKNNISGTYLFEKENPGYAVHDLGFKFDFTDQPVSACDVDNDLDLDIVYGAYILINDAVFIKKDVFPYKDVRSMDWGDFDGDKDMDVAIFGRDTVDNLGTRIFENHGNLNFSPSKSNIRATGDGYLRWLDFNNDGLLDLTLSGYRDGSHVFIYLNQGNSFFEETEYLHHPSSDWGDFDEDGDLDILHDSWIYISNGDWINTPPEAPSGLSYTLDEFDVILSWDRAWDHENSNGLMYNVKVGSNEGSYDVMQVLTAADGQLRIPRMGNVQTNTGWRLKNLPLGEYYWSVQAVDQGYKGGEWAPEQKFTISSVSASFTADTVCEGFPTKFTDFSVASEGNLTAWKWRFGDGDSSMLQNPSHVYAHGGFYNVTLTAYAADHLHSITGTIFVRYKPHAGFDASTVCEGNKTTFVNHSDIESITVDNWIWNFGDGDVSDVRGDVQHPYLAPGTYEAQLLITATNGCKDSLTKEVVVGKIPINKIGLDYGSKNMCTGDSSRLMVESSADYSYQWRKDGINMAKDTLNALLIKNKGDFSVEITNRLGNCSVISDTIGFTMLEAPPVMLVTSGADTEICQGDSVYFEVPYNAAYSYDWKYNGNSMNATSNLIYAGKEGSYAAEVSNGTCSTMSQSRQVAYKPGLPEPTLMAFGPNRWYFVCNTENAQIYRWYYNGDLVAENKNNLYYAGTRLGEYYVEVNDGGECFVPSDKVVIPVIPTGINDLPAENKLFLYPNPASGSIRVLYSGPYRGDVLIRIISAGGGIAKEYLGQKDHTDLSEELDLAGFDPGIYLMELITNDNMSRSIFMIRK